MCDQAADLPVGGSAQGFDDPGKERALADPRLAAQEEAGAEGFVGLDELLERIQGQCPHSKMR